MRALIYVEGPSDKAAMRALLRPLIEQKAQAGVAIEFFEAPEGDKKVSVLMKAPRKAVNILLNDPYSIVVVMPDLYPKNKGFPHETVTELTRGVLKLFDDALQAKKIEDDRRIRNRFKVFCFKYDLEALILAAEEPLKDRLEVKSLSVTWRLPVEEQDHDHPPKRIVQELFISQGKHYRETVDAPLILGASEYYAIAERCSQCFKPFVEFLEGLKPQPPQ